LVLVKVLLVQALLVYYLYYGDDFNVECPTGSGGKAGLSFLPVEISADMLILKTKSVATVLTHGAFKWCLDVAFLALPTE